ncbi:MAG: substrate-binding domain-containing protein [Spirochaetes bacterium]|jgi:LacI family transcriptional regulator|nr:substrate-binding domain-containing protein [Spirochaetota bacterium]
MQRRLTIRDIARIAEVSPSTVSRSLNDSRLVSVETKARIREIAERGNFSFNATARSLVTQRTGIIGLICPDSFDEYQYSLHLTLLINQIRRTLETEDRDLIVKFRHDANGENSIRHLLNSRKVDGLIVINPDITADEVAFIHDQRIPVVFVQAIPPHLDLAAENYVFADHVAGGTFATNHLIRLGHERIVCFTVDTDEGSFGERTEGYRQALRDHDLPVNEELIVGGDGTFEFGYQFVVDHAERFRTGITAVFSQTDIMALGAIEGLWDSGLQVPRDVAIVSYDDIGFGKDFRPRLTTVHQPRDRLAVAACKRLGEMLGAPRSSSRGGMNGAGVMNQHEGETLLQRRVQPYLVVRESCGAERRDDTVAEKTV